MVKAITLGLDHKQNGNKKTPYFALIINYLSLNISEKIIIFAYRNNSIYIKSISLYGGSHFCTYRSRRLLCFVWHPQRSLGRLDKERL